MKLSRTVSYAVRATLQLAQLQAHGPIPCSRLAADGKMPERFLLQILRNLVTHGILRSTRGVDGGYALVRPADEISLFAASTARYRLARVGGGCQSANRRDDGDRKPRDPGDGNIHDKLFESAWRKAREPGRTLR